MFSNAKSVEINGKEVKSIILENGAILYEKEYPYVLSVSSDKDILSYADQDSATLTASLTKGGVPVEGEEVIFHTNKPIKGPVIYSSGDIITLSEGEEILIPKNAQFNIDTGTNGSGDYFHWNNGDFEYGNINGDIVITSSSLGRTVTVPKVSGTINTISSITIKKINGEYIVEDSNSDLIVEYSPNYDNGTLTTNLEIELGGDTNTISLTTDNNGIVTYQYNSQGIGDIIFNINCMNLQETYELIDAKYYASNETINLAPRYNNDRNLFASDYQIQEGDKIHFRFKNITNHMLWGIGSTAGSDFTFEQVGTRLKYWRNVLNNGSYNNPSFLPNTTEDFVMEYAKYDSTQWKVNIYIGDKYVDYWRCGNSIRKVRIDKCDDSSPSWDVEVFVL